MTDRHKDKPKAVRMPGGLLAWYKQEAPARSISVNALIVAALQEYRARHDDRAAGDSGLTATLTATGNTDSSGQEPTCMP